MMEKHTKDFQQKVCSHNSSNSNTLEEG